MNHNQSADKGTTTVKGVEKIKKGRNKLGFVDSAS